MNNDKIIEGNKLIAFSDFSSEGIHEWVHSMDSTPSDNFCSKVLNYHEKWEMLMPVVEKIRKTNVNIGYGISFHIMNDECWFGIDNLRHEGFNNHLSDSLIASIWLACIEFINWYNQQNK